MELIQIWKAWSIVYCVTPAPGVQVLEWRHLRNALMEHIATQLVLDIVFCVQKVIGEVNYQHVSGISTNWPQTSLDHPTVHPCRISAIHICCFIFFICTGWLPQSHITDITPIIQSPIFVGHFTLVLAISPSRFSNCSFMSPFIHVLMNIGWQWHRQTSDITSGLSNSPSMWYFSFVRSWWCYSTKCSSMLCSVHQTLIHKY